MMIYFYNNDQYWDYNSYPYLFNSENFEIFYKNNQKVGMKNDNLNNFNQNNLKNYNNTFYSTNPWTTALKPLQTMHNGINLPNNDPLTPQSVSSSIITISKLFSLTKKRLILYLYTISTTWLGGLFGFSDFLLGLFRFYPRNGTLLLPNYPFPLPNDSHLIVHRFKSVISIKPEFVGSWYLDGGELDGLDCGYEDDNFGHKIGKTNLYKKTNYSEFGAINTALYQIDRAYGSNYYTQDVPISFFPWVDSEGDSRMTSGGENKNNIEKNNAANDQYDRNFGRNNLSCKNKSKFDKFVEKIHILDTKLDQIPFLMDIYHYGDGQLIMDQNHPLFYGKKREICVQIYSQIENKNYFNSNNNFKFVKNLKKLISKIVNFSQFFYNFEHFYSFCQQTVLRDPLLDNNYNQEPRYDANTGLPSTSDVVLAFKDLEKFDLNAILTVSHPFYRQIYFLVNEIYGKYSTEWSMTDGIIWDEFEKKWDELEVELERKNGEKSGEKNMNQKDNFFANYEKKNNFGDFFNDFSMNNGVKLTRIQMDYLTRYIIYTQHHIETHKATLAIRNKNTLFPYGKIQPHFEEIGQKSNKNNQQNSNFNNDEKKIIFTADFYSKIMV